MIENLFGRYDYVLPTENDSFHNLGILYGDNGTGKTTVYNLVFHMLSPDNNRGHRLEISTIPFRHFEIHLNDGMTLSASRKKDPFSPSYTIECKPPKKKSFFVSYDQREERALFPVNAENEFIKFLNDLGLKTFILSADRQICSDSTPEDNSDDK
jgi:predicted ATP-binding protein involved in virulence